MDWLSILATGLVAGIVLFLLIAGAIGIGLRRYLRAGGLGGRTVPDRQVVEALTMLQRQSVETRAQIQALAQAHKRMVGELDALRESVGDGGPKRAPSGPSGRILH